MSKESHPAGIISPEKKKKKVVLELGNRLGSGAPQTSD